MMGSNYYWRCDCNTFRGSHECYKWALTATTLSWLVKRLRHFPSTEKLSVRFRYYGIGAQFMLCSSNRSGSIPLKDKIWVRAPYRVPMTGENGDRGINQTVRTRCGSDSGWNTTPQCLLPSLKISYFLILTFSEISVIIIVQKKLRARTAILLIDTKLEI